MPPTCPQPPLTSAAVTESGRQEPLLTRIDPETRNRRPEGVWPAVGVVARGGVEPPTFRFLLRW